MTKKIIIGLILIVLLMGIYFFVKHERIPLVIVAPDITTSVPQAGIAVEPDGRSCYAYDHAATTDAPYTVHEDIDVIRTGDTVTGIKSGTQIGSDMTNGYTGTLTGTVNRNLLTAVYSYTIEGSAQKEKELYTVGENELVKHRYALKEDGGVLVPDMKSEPKDMIYVKVSCPTQ